jgi:hypothetical protein
MDTYSMVSWVMTVVAICFVLIIAYQAATDKDEPEVDEKDEEDKKDE